MSTSSFSHLGDDQQARMVDVGQKKSSLRTAQAEATVRLSAEIAQQLAETGGVAKGNVIETARIAGIMAAKRTAEFIPMCHPLLLDCVKVEVELHADRVTILSEVRCQGVTGVEMEAMTAASVAALTMYDMCKSAGKGITIERVRLLTKTGGKSGNWSCTTDKG